MADERLLWERCRACGGLGYFSADVGGEIPKTKTCSTCHGPGGWDVRLESVPVFETLMDNAGLHPVLEPYTRGPLWREVS